MSDWRPAACLVVLKQKLDTTYPKRPKDSDGMLASAAHHSANPTSDHEPRDDPAGGPPVVLAFDITTWIFTDQLAEDLRLLGQAGDRRVKYVIYERRIASARDNWAWRAYTGTSPHTDHIHLSVINDPSVYDSTAAWPVLQHVTGHTVSKPTPVDQETDMVIIYATGKPTALFADGKIKSLKSNREKDALTAAGIPVKHVTPEQFNLIQGVTQR